MTSQSAASSSEAEENEARSPSDGGANEQDMPALLGDDAQTSSSIFDFAEVVAVGACLGGLYAAGQAGQFWTAFFVGMALLFIYFERHHRKQLDELINRIRSH